MEVYRIAQEPFADDLSGNGARLFGGRWNSEGLFALYTSTSRALALLETLAHSPAKMLLQKNYILVTLFITETSKVQVISLDELPLGWDAPDTRPITKNLGDTFLRNQNHLLLSVPSVLMPEERNIILNPLHNDIKKVRIKHKRRIVFDNRTVTNI
jgi:RES domain-containing protein